MLRRTFLHGVSFGFALPDALQFLSEAALRESPTAARAQTLGSERYRIRLNRDRRPEAEFVLGERFVMDRLAERISMEELVARLEAERSANVHGNSSQIPGWESLSYRETNAFTDELCLVNRPDGNGGVVAQLGAYNGRGPRVIGTAWAIKPSARRCLRDVILTGRNHRWNLELGGVIEGTSVTM